MSTPMETLGKFINFNVELIINSFESGMYDNIVAPENSRIDLLTSNHDPFMDIHKDLHEIYFTNLYNQLVRRENIDVFNAFQAVSSITSHSIYCLLNILSQVTPYVHFNFNRKNLNTTSKQVYSDSVTKEIRRLLHDVNLDSLTNHQCTISDITQRKILTKDESFLGINITKKS